MNLRVGLYRLLSNQRSLLQQASSLSQSQATVSCSRHCLAALYSSSSLHLQHKELSVSSAKSKKRSASASNSQPLTTTTSTRPIHSFHRQAETSTMTSSKQRILVALDFDHTVVDENTDYYVIKLAPDQELPEDIKSLYRDNNWIDYMRQVFKYLHEKGSTKEDILDCVAEIPLTQGMKELFTLKRDGLDIDFIIVSDSNSVFIQHILDKADLSSNIHTVFTNPAKFDDCGRLLLDGYHEQYDCTLSSENLCKGDILQKFMAQRKQSSSVDYASVFYAGDGFNDLCPGLTLQPKDFLLPRTGFRLKSVVDTIQAENKPVDSSRLIAKVYPWSTGYDIIELIDEWLSHK